jgi:YD repeat-containing protein
MKKIFVLAGLLSALVFTSCKKDKDSNDDNNNGGGNNPTTKLVKKMTETENGVNTVYNFTYNDAKKLTRFASADGKEYVNFTYDAAGNLTKVESVEDDFKNVYTYTYNNNVPVTGALKTWEVVNGQAGDLIEDDELTYTVENGQVSKIKLYMKQSDLEVNMNLTYTNGNLTKIESAPNSTYTYKATFTFGSKKSPFPQLSKYVLDQAGFSLMFSSKNELTSAAYDFPGTGFDYTITHQYTYDASGYPLTSNDGDVVVKYEYQ